MRIVRLGLGLLLAAAPVGADELELRPPRASLEVQLGPRERPAKPRVFWLCYGADLGIAARNWLHERVTSSVCETALLEPGSDELARQLEAAARGRVLGDAEDGEARSLDPEPGRQKQLTAHYCYTAADVGHIEDWTRRQLAARCGSPDEAGPPAER
jgi:hypothetical protein